MICHIFFRKATYNWEPRKQTKLQCKGSHGMSLNQITFWYVAFYALHGTSLTYILSQIKLSYSKKNNDRVWLNHLKHKVQEGNEYVSFVTLSHMDWWTNFTSLYKKDYGGIKLTVAS